MKKLLLAVLATIPGTAAGAGPVSSEPATVTWGAGAASLATVQVTGTVSDGSGHGWPLYARVNVAGVPGATTFTDPETGAYSLDLPSDATYNVIVTPVYGGYRTVTESVPVGAGDLSHDFAVPVEASTCDAPGYGFAVQGLSEAFDTGSLPSGWTVVDHLGNGQVWRFDSPFGRPNQTGGSGGFGIVDSFFYIPGTQDTSLVTPTIDLTGVSRPAVRFRQDFQSISLGPAIAQVDLSVDDGATWQPVFQRNTALPGPRDESLSLAAAAGQPDVRLRFRYTATTPIFGSALGWWEVDDVRVVDCAPMPGGLVVGHVADQNTGGAVNGARVVATDDPSRPGISTATPDDPAQADGFYWLFSSPSGSHQFTASANSYTTDARAVDVAADSVTRADFALGAGQLSVTPTAIESAAELGDSRRPVVTVENTGTQPVEIEIVERRGGFELLGADGSTVTEDEIMHADGGPVREVSGTFSPLSQVAADEGPAADPRPIGPDAAPWTNIADYPETTMDAGGALVDGKLYSFGGFDGFANTRRAFVYDPVRMSWSPIRQLPVLGLENPAVAAIDGKIYITGGWNVDGSNSDRTWRYDPATDSYTELAAQPLGLAASGRVVLDDALYTVGGCRSTCTFTQVQKYDPATDSWTQVADYPEPIAHVACGPIGEAIYCAGGISTTGTRNSYVYEPDADSWTPIASLPIDLWGMGYTAAGDRLLVSGGVTQSGNAVTNRSLAYSPVTNSWTELPPSNSVVFRSGSACGFFKIGGSIGDFLPTTDVEVLPGMDDCDDAVDVDWLSADPTTATLDPGESVTVGVTLDSSVLLQPGTYNAGLRIKENTPYPAPAVDVTLDVTPPAKWGRLTGQVQGLACDGTASPLPDATVQVNGKSNDWTLLTGADGRYAYWIDSRENPLTLIAAKDDYELAVSSVRLRAGATVNADFDLARTLC